MAEGATDRTSTDRISMLTRGIPGKEATCSGVPFSAIFKIGHFCSNGFKSNHALPKFKYVTYSFNSRYKGIYIASTDNCFGSQR